MFSIIVSTRRGIEAIKPLFITSSPDAEIIIIHSDYNDEMKAQLKELKHNFQKVVYAPPREKKYFKRDFLMGLNTALCYAEHEYVIKVDDETELEPQFFENARESFELLHKDKEYENIVLRPVKLEEWNNHKRWQRSPYLESINKRYVVLDQKGVDGSGKLFVTLDQLVAPLEVMLEINGYDERYDIGHGYDDNDIMMRILAYNYKVVMDQMLLTYQHTHTPVLDLIDELKSHYQWSQLSIMNGRFMAYNPFCLRTLRDSYLKKKDEYVI